MMRQINLIPKDVVARAEQKTRQLSLGLAGAVTLLVIGGIYLILAVSLAQAKGELRRLQVMFPSQTETSPEDQLKQLELQIGNLYAAYPEVNPFLVNHDAYINLLKGITQAVEGRVRLQSLTVNLDLGECQMKGSAGSQEVVSDFVAVLKELPFFDRVELVSLEKSSEGGTAAAQFEARCRLAMQ